jgi:GT2 family glycosyltransferase
VISDQIAAYDAEDFDCDNLVESNVLMFNLRHAMVPKFLDLWWREIDRGSRRDQLSFNYALRQAGLDYFRLTEKPNSVRNHPLFALLNHDGDSGAAAATGGAIAQSVGDPWKGGSYSSVRHRRIRRYRDLPIDIVICVHNALDDVRACLASVDRAKAGSAQRVILVDDGSSQETRDYLARYAEGRRDVLLHRNERAAGYTRAANIGLKLSTAGFVILLNSDTIVTNGWAEKMADALFSTPGAGIVGPMSSAASHQSIPEHRSTNGQTAMNELPPGLTAEDLNRYCEQWTPAHVMPRVPLAHGFCFGVSRTVIDEIGGFDETNFPRGYGEENDYCFRASDAGFGLVVATHTYVFHAKSKSYVGPERVGLMKAGSAALRRLHGKGRVERAVRSMQENPLLVRLRSEAAALYVCSTGIEEMPVRRRLRS